MGCKKSQKYCGIIFDFNGVLWWDAALQELTWSQVAEEIRGLAFNDQEMTEIMHGRASCYILEYLANRPLSDQEIEAIVEEKETSYKNMCLAKGSEFRLSPGSYELLDFLLANNIPHTIATGSAKSNVDFFVKYLALHKWFDITKIVYDNGKIRGKELCKNNLVIWRPD